MSPTTSTSALDPSPSPALHQDISAGPAGSPSQQLISLPSGQLPPGFVPITMGSPSQPPPSQTTPRSPYSTPAALTNVGVMSPRMSARADPRALYGVPVPDASSSSGRLSLHNPGVHIPLSSTTADSSVMVPPASLFSQPNEPSSSETDEDDAVASSLASSNDTLSTPPPSSRKKPSAKKGRRPTYDAAPTQPGTEYPASPLARASTLPSPGPSATSASQAPRGSAGMTPAARQRNLRH